MKSAGTDTGCVSPVVILKRVAAIFLILMHLLNIVGYHGLFFGLEALNNKEILTDLDFDIYAGSDAITLRVPISLPYPVNHDNYQRVNGAFEYEGVLYRLVKQKLYNDTLYVVCYKDQVGKKIKDAIQEMAHAINDQPTDNKSGSGKKLANVIKDFEGATTVDTVPTFAAIRKADFNPAILSYTHSHTFSIDHPPKA